MLTTNIQPILDRVLAGEGMTVEECTTLLESHDIARMGVAADEIRARRHPDNVVTYIIDRNINYTNVCNVVCTFCAFYRRPGAPDTLSLIHISEPTRQAEISYAVFCLKKK